LLEVAQAAGPADRGWDPCAGISKRAGRDRSACAPAGVGGKRTSLGIRSGMQRRALTLVLLLAASCSADISAAQARQKSDEYVRSEFNVRNFGRLNVQTAEHANGWVVSYSTKGEALGGPLVVGIDKKTGRAHLIEGYQ
jgi:hypothetical protein